eukprot:gene3434-3929_t
MDNFAQADEDSEEDGKRCASINNRSPIENDWRSTKTPTKCPSRRSSLYHRGSDTESFTYEHFPVVCPTCRGSGKVSEEDVNKLVAFVPIKDERLKPSRIFCKMLLMLFFFACISVPLAFFLIPRSVTMELLKITSVNISIPDDPKLTPFIIVQTGVKIHNQNYLKVNIENVRINVSWNKIILNTDTCEKVRKTVSSRSTSEFPVEVKMIFKGSSGKNLRHECAYGWKTHIPQKFVATAALSYLNQDLQISVTKYPYVQCYDFGRLN